MTCPHALLCFVVLNLRLRIGLSIAVCCTFMQLKAATPVQVLRMDPDAITWSPREKSTYPGDLKRAFVLRPGLQVLQHAANTSLRSQAQVCAVAHHCVHIVVHGMVVDIAKSSTA